MTLQKMLLLPATVVGIVTCLTLLFQPISTQTLNSPDLNNYKTDLVAFDTYEDMHEYVANRVQRGLRQLDNPTDDSYIEAFNQHNEQPSQNSIGKRQKRQLKPRSLPNEPKLFRFEISDAVEPNDEVKQLIKKHRSRELMLEKSTTVRPEKTNSGNRNVMRLAPSVEKSKSFRVGRTKRMAPHTPSTNFQVHLIPFEASDAREPDEETRKLIKRMRALELEQLHQIQATTKPTLAPLPKPQRTPPTVQPILAKQPATVPSLSTTLSRPKASKLRMKTMPKRTRRSASQQKHTAPQMFKFELEDAKEPDQSIKALMEQQNLSRESREMKINTTHFERKSDSGESTSELEDQSSEESKRYYFYKEAPVKSKKSVNSLPHQVQKAITHIFKDNQGAKAYVKYLPAQKMDYNHLRSMAYSGAKAVGSLFHGQKSAHVAPAFVKYVQVAPQPQIHQVQIHPVPVVEKVRYVYTAAPSHSAHAQAYVPQHYATVQHSHVHQQPVAHPIVVPEAGYVKQAPAQIAEVHHTYSADLAYAQKQAEAEEAALHDHAQQFHASRPDPYYEENKMGAGEAAAEAEPKAKAPQEQEQQEAPAAEHNYVPVENYKYEHYSKVPQGYIAEGKAHQEYAEQPAQPAPLIKIEYHAAPDAIKQNYKELAEFKELSVLMGKSPEDQFHGLTYLIAKEMQAKRQQKRQQKKLADEALIVKGAVKQRPQDNTSPILFHPPGSGEQEQKAVASNAELSHQVGQTVRLIGMGKSKQYIPIVEQIEPKAVDAAQAIEQQQHQVYAAPVENKNYAAQESPKFRAPSSFTHYDLSPNYEGSGKAHQNAIKIPETKVLHHASLAHRGHGGAYKVVKSNQHGGGGDGSTAASHAGVEIELEHSGGGDAGEIQHGKTLHFRTQIDERESMQYASKYAFGYRIRDFHTGNDFGHKQNRDLDGVTRGQYHILLPDGRIQNVIYHADDTGFHADVSFETGH